MEVKQHHILLVYLVKDKPITHYYNEDLLQDISASKARSNEDKLFGPDTWDAYSFVRDRLVTTEYALVLRQRDGSIGDSLVVSNGDGLVAPSVMETLAQLYLRQRQDSPNKVFWSFSERPVSGFNDELIQGESAAWPPVPGETLQRMGGEDSHSARDWAFAPATPGALTQSEFKVQIERGRQIGSY
jgi:hypothetical protein